MRLSCAPLQSPMNYLRRADSLRRPRHVESMYRWVTSWWETELTTAFYTKQLTSWTQCSAFVAPCAAILIEALQTDIIQNFKCSIANTLQHQGRLCTLLRRTEHPTLLRIGLRFASLARKEGENLEAESLWFEAMVSSHMQVEQYQAASPCEPRLDAARKSEQRHQRKIPYASSQVVSITDPVSILLP